MKAKKSGCDMKEKIGIAFAGNILTDNVKFVENYPQKGMLATIESEALGVGGCVPNTAITIKTVDPDLQVKAYGRVANDYKGEFVLSQMKNVGIDVSGIKISDKYPTSYSDVITVKETGERTFFHNRGANKEFTPSDVDIDGLDCKILHAGYIMLLDSFDLLNQDSSSVMSNFLKGVQARGIKTSVDLVSEQSGDFKKLAQAAFKYCDYVIINEIESGLIAGISARDDKGQLDDQAVGEILNRLMQMGVKEKVIIHAPEKAYCLDKSGKKAVVPSIKLPKGFIKGSVGAGDAFCAGCLYAIYNDYADEQMLSFANLVAINCLSQPDSVSGIVHKDKLKNVLN